MYNGGVIVQYVLVQGMQAQAPPASILTLSLRMQGLCIIATPFVWDIASWWTIPAALQFPTLLNVQRAAMKKLAAPVLGSAELLRDMFLTLPVDAPSFPTQLPDVMLHLHSHAIPAARKQLQRLQVDQSSGEAPSSAMASEPPEPFGMAMRISTQMVSPAVFLVENLSNPRSAALAMTFDIRAWVDMSPCGDMAVVSDVSGFRGFRVDAEPLQAHSPRSEHSLPYQRPATHYRVPPEARSDYLRPCSVSLFYAARIAREGIPPLTQIRLSSLQDVRARLGYRDVALFQRAIGSLMGTTTSAATPAVSPSPTPEPLAPVPEAPKYSSKLLSTHISCVMPCVEVLVTNDISGMNLPLAAFRTENTSISWLGSHFENRTIVQMGMPPPCVCSPFA
jgi:hypothetical protein